MNNFSRSAIRFSIRNKIILSMMIMVLFSSLLIAVISLHNLKKNIDKDISSHLLSVQTLQKHRIETFLTHSRKQLQLITSRTQLRKLLLAYYRQPSNEISNELDRILLDAMRSDSNYISISILDINGKIVASTDKAITGKETKLNFAYWKSVPTVQALSIDGNNNLVLRAHEPLIKNGEVLGMTTVTFTATALYSIVKDYAGLGESGETILAERLPNGDARFLTPLRFDAYAALKRTIPAKRSDVPIILSLQGKAGFNKNVVDYREIPVLAVTSYLPEVRWGLLLKIDKTEAYASYNNLKQIFIFMIVLILFGSLIAASFLSRSISKPIESLTGIARRIKQGERNVQFHYDLASDRETIELTQALSSLVHEFLETFDAAANGMVILDQDGIIQRVNERLLDCFGYKVNELVGKTIEVLVPLHFRERHVGLRNQYMRNPVSRSMGKRLTVNGVHKDGKEIPLEIGLSPIDSSGKTLILATVTDITNQVAYENDLLSRANYDSLTNLPNRRLFMELLEQEIKEAKRYKKQLWLLFLDLDGFKEVNDKLGHAKGDELLKITAHRLQSSLRNSDIIARLGGDEFLVLLLDRNTGRESIDPVASSILKACSEPYILGADNPVLSVSIGIASYPEDAINAEEMVKCADEAMYAAKRKGKNNFNYST